MERKVARGLGSRSDKEKRYLEDKKRNLEIEKDIYGEKKKNLRVQCKLLQRELQRWRKRSDGCLQNENDIKNTFSKVELEISSCDVNLKRAIFMKEESMVSHDLIRLEVKRLRDSLRCKVGYVRNLCDERERIINESKKQKEFIKLQINVQVAQWRAAEEERHKSAVRRGAQSVAAEKMKHRYEILAKTKCEGHENDSLVHHLIRIAQKRADLQREGDRLDSDIRTKDTEIRTMVNTLKHLEARNTNFRASMSKVNIHGSHLEAFTKERETWEQLDKEMLGKRHQIKESKRKLNTLNNNIEKARKNISQLVIANSKMYLNKSEVNTEIKELSEKIAMLQGLLIEGEKRYVKFISSIQTAIKLHQNKGPHSITV
jgi:predicted  nucleic acid-binding Zn-ribbon protein